MIKFVKQSPCSVQNEKEIQYDTVNKNSLLATIFMIFLYSRDHYLAHTFLVYNAIIHI